MQQLKRPFVKCCTFYNCFTKGKTFFCFFASPRKKNNFDEELNQEKVEFPNYVIVR